jgi:hypothetical protein
MSRSRRPFLAVVLAALAGVTPWGPPAQAQQRPTAMNANIYANPSQALGQGRPSALAGFSTPNYGAGTPGYGSLGTYGGSSPGMGDYSALLANSGSGGYGSSGNGTGGYGGYGNWPVGLTNWMQNPYEGYLRGAADVTNANAQYQLTIQQAKLQRQEAVRSAMDTRKRIIEEAEYERAHLPDPEKIRQADLARELDRARADPPLTEVWSGRALNTLLRHLVAQQGKDARGPNVPLSEDMLRDVNVTPASSRANAGLLKGLREKNELQWPQPLMDPMFKEAREDMSRQLKEAVQQVRNNTEAQASTLKDLAADLRAMNDTLEANVSKLSPSQYIEARRYLNMVGDAVKALESRDVTNFFDKWVARGKNVAELVDFMGKQGLQFAPATPGDEPAYRALYHAMAAFDARRRGAGGREQD